jgi:hypothetical protein
VYAPFPLLPSPFPPLSHPILLTFPQNGTIDIYPSTTQLQILDPTSKLSSYSFPPSFLSHQFCSVCGVLVYIKKLKVPEEVYNERLVFGKRMGDIESQETWESVVPVNLRCFEGVEWEGIKVKRSDFRDDGLRYEV